MLDKNPKTRITADECLEHEWFKKVEYDTPMEVKHAIVSRMKNFRAPKQFQLEALKFLVNNITMDIDFKSLREAFRLIDTSNSGRITIEQVRKGFSHDNHVTFVDEKLIE